MVAAMGTANRTPIKPPKMPSTQDPTSAPTSIATKTVKGLSFTVRLMITGLSTWF